MIGEDKAQLIAVDEAAGEGYAKRVFTRFKIELNNHISRLRAPMSDFLFECEFTIVEATTYEEFQALLQKEATASAEPKPKEDGEGDKDRSSDKKDSKSSRSRSGSRSRSRSRDRKSV